MHLINATLDKLNGESETFWTDIGNGTDTRIWVEAPPYPVDWSTVPYDDITAEGLAES